MSQPLKPRIPKNPLKHTQVGHVIPTARSRAAIALASHAALGHFALQSCMDCQSVTYPPRDRCPKCWGVLEWQELPSGAEVIAQTTIRATTDAYFRDHLPWRMGTVKLDAGPTALVHLHGDVSVGSRVLMELKLDRGATAALFALPEKETPNMKDDPQYREFTASPQMRRILVTDGRNAVGQQLAIALVEAGATKVFLGISDFTMRFDGQEKIQAINEIELVPLSLLDTRSVQELAAQLGGKIEIVINTAQHVRQGGVAFGGKLTDLQRAMEVNVIGFTRLAQAFCPALSGRSGDGHNPAVALVDVLSVDAITGNPPFAGFAASAAARFALGNSLRSEMRQTGIRVMSVLVGPTEDEWHQNIPTPKVLPAQTAKAIIGALKAGHELTCVGEIAKDTLAKWQNDPLLTIREVNQ